MKAFLKRRIVIVIAYTTALAITYLVKFFSALLLGFQYPTILLIALGIYIFHGAIKDMARFESGGFSFFYSVVFWMFPKLLQPGVLPEEKTP